MTINNEPVLFYLLTVGKGFVMNHKVAIKTKTDAGKAYSSVPFAISALLAFCPSIGLFSQYAMLK